MDNVKSLCKFVGGSQLYGLATPQSDMDERGLFMSTDAKHIIGTGRFNEERKQNAAIQQDVVFKELSHWVRLLAQSNTEAYEMLFADRTVFTVYEKEFDEFRKNAMSFMDSRRLFNCLRGYAQSEFRLAKGERVGVLGSKRKQALDLYGFSHRNASHLIRLLATGVRFFTDELYPVHCRDLDPIAFKLVQQIKFDPTSYNVQRLDIDYQVWEARLVDAYEKRKRSFSFNEQTANRMLLDAYFPVLKSEYEANNL